MEFIALDDPRFAEYGRVLQGYDFSTFIPLLKKITPIPEKNTVYVPSVPALEVLPVADDLRNRGFGGLDIQIGYCNGTNFRLTCLEYHRTSEIDIACTDMILLLARQQDLQCYTLDTSKVRAFFIPEGTAVELFATTLHYAPCGAAPGKSFFMGCVLPRGTNEEKPEVPATFPEDRLLAGKNKWVIAGKNAEEAAHGAFVGLHGPEIELFSGK